MLSWWRRMEELNLRERVKAEEDEKAKSEALRRGVEEEKEALAPSVEKEEEKETLAPSVEKEEEKEALVPSVEEEEGLGEKKIERGDRRKVDEAKEDLETKRLDYEARKASEFRDGWIDSWSAWFGSFDDTTKLGPMRFTDEPAPECSASPLGTLQVFSVKVVGIRGGLQWPFDVFGFVAVRDKIDYNRNIIFSRTRDCCQTLTKEDQYLVLAGPTRAVMWSDNVTIEVKLTVKGTTEAEDKDLSFLAVPLLCSDQMYSYLFRNYRTSKLSTLEFTLGHIVRSVEATIFVRVIDGSWPDGFRGQFAAFTTGNRHKRGIRHKRAKSIDHAKIVLLDSGGDKVFVTSDGEIKLSRHVVSVETSGKLKVCVKSWEASESDKNVVDDGLVFTPKEANRSYSVLDAGFCKILVTVAWSLISYYPCYYDSGETTGKLQDSVRACEASAADNNVAEDEFIGSLI